MPLVQPYYAVKCNSDKVLIETLAGCGVGFDAASPAEISAVLEYAPASQIIYANPCKRISDIHFAVCNGVQTTVIDNVQEYDKIPPNMGVLLRIYADDETAQCTLSNKYGAMESEWLPIMEHIRIENKSVLKGISFHVGSGANDPTAFRRAIQSAISAFDLATKMGFHMTVLDIGGGFSHLNIERMATDINGELTRFAVQYPNATVIAEPGRYFAASVANLYTKIIGVRIRLDAYHYWINDSLYGSFNCILYDHSVPDPECVSNKNRKMPAVPAVVWGATCDGFDKIIELENLPALRIGEWLMWRNMGAYTQSGASCFNGIPFANIRKVYV